MLRTVARSIDTLNEKIGVVIAWLALFMVLLEFVVVLLRYVFGVGWISMQESVVYMHATLFMVAAGYTLRQNGHVRCDIFYAESSRRGQAKIDLIGTFVFLLPMCVVIFLTAWPYVMASWAVFEGSGEGRMGLPLVYALKTVILVFVVLLTLQAVALIVHSALVLMGQEDDAAPSEETAS